MSELSGAQQAAAAHHPVMLDRIVELLSPALQHEGAVHVDGTLGMGGHAAAMLAANPQARLVGIDRDPQALDLARARLEPFADRITLVRAVYDELPEVLDDLGLLGVDSVLLDLGLSSLQIDRTERGFSYATDAPLDMRMGDSGPTAADLLNTLDEAELERIIRIYGEERFSNRIARAIVREREREPFTRSARLVEVIAAAIPAAARHTGGHPAKRTFQGLRIQVNAELEALDGVLPAAVDALLPGGRFAVLAYHSLEDRAVKRCFRDATTDRAPVGLPMVPDHLKAQYRLLTRGAERPDEQETGTNRRAASARLRAVERLGGAQSPHSTPTGADRTRSTKEAS